jgi:hypothetical protein
MNFNISEPICITNIKVDFEELSCSPDNIDQTCNYSELNIYKAEQKTSSTYKCSDVLTGSHVESHVNSLIKYEDFSHLSSEFVENLIICEKKIIKSNHGWIIDFIRDKKSIIEIAKNYLKKIEYDGNYAACSSGALFDNFIRYKNNEKFNGNATCLLQKSGIIVMCMVSHNVEDPTVHFLTVAELILEYDGDGYFEWLEKIAENEV